MEMKENKLLGRKEIKYLLEYNGSPTPSRDNIREVLSRNTNSKAELIIIQRNIQKTGKGELEGYAKIYNKKEDAMLFEPDYELFRNKLKTKKGEN